MEQQARSAHTQNSSERDDRRLVGDAHRFGPPHLRQIVRKVAVQSATEKSQGNTTVTVPVQPEFAESLRAARAAGIIGAEVFTGKLVRGRVLPMNKKAWAMKFKKYAVLAGVNEPKKSCHGVRKARAEVAAYAECTESQMMAMFGWTDPKMPARYIAQANREKLGVSGMDKICRVRSEPVAGRLDGAAGSAQDRNGQRERSCNFPG
jgi:integrase